MAHHNHKGTQAQATLDLTWQLMLMLLAAVVAGAAPEMAAAAPGGTVIGGMICHVVNWFTGPLGQGLATIALIVIGLGALMGKVSWGMAIIVGVGVAIIFGAAALVGELGSAGNQNISGCGGAR